MAKWKIAWDIFITETKSKACMHTFQNLTPSVHRIFPKEGHINGDTKIFKLQFAKQSFVDLAAN
jgi:hypothetical protein